jgi:hypothetical protein
MKVMGSNPSYLLKYFYFNATRFPTFLLIKNPREGK